MSNSTNYHRLKWIARQIDLVEHNPTRPPDWRWQRIQAGTRAGAPARQVFMCLKRGYLTYRVVTDATIRWVWYCEKQLEIAGKENVKSLERKSRNTARSRAHKTYGDAALPAYLAAKKLFANGEQDMASSMLEGMVCAGVSHERIAQLLGLPADIGANIVAAYEAIWFDVRDRMDGHAWVHATVLGTYDMCKIPSDRQMYRYLGYLERLTIEENGDNKEPTGDTLLGWLTNRKSADMTQELQRLTVGFANRQMTRAALSGTLLHDRALSENASVINQMHKLSFEISQKTEEKAAGGRATAQASLFEGLDIVARDIRQAVDFPVELRSNVLLAIELEKAMGVRRNIEVPDREGKLNGVSGTAPDADPPSQPKE